MAETAATARVIRLPTRLTVTCPSCRHQATIRILLEHVGKLTCSKCGHRDPIIAGREPLRQWSRQRRGR
jgi:hypothetical protein